MKTNKTKKQIKKHPLAKPIRQQYANHKKYLQKQHSLHAQSLLLSQINSTSQQIIIQLFFGASIYQDGIVRQITALDHVSLGWMQGKITQIEQFRQQNGGGCINIEQTPKNMSILEMQAIDISIAEEIQRKHLNIDLHEILFNTRKLGIKRILRNEQDIRDDYECQDDSGGYPQQHLEHLPAQLDSAISFLNKGQGSLSHQLAESISHFFSLFQKEESLFLPSMKTSLQLFLQLKNEQFFRYINESFKYLQTLPADSMYSYTIGRVHPITYQLESFHFGYSQAYLDLLGIDGGTLSQLFLRKKTIELVSDPQDITRMSANIINWMVNSKECQFMDVSKGIDSRQEEINEIICNSKPISIRITTFDGFQLTLHQQQHLIPTPGEIIFKEGNCSECPCEYFLKVFEFDVELTELESLIGYRQRLMKKNGKLSIDDLIKKELSFLFEDVEYSVFSQEFLEKYYAESLPALMTKKQQILNKEQDKLRCKFKDINGR